MAERNFLHHLQPTSVRRAVLHPLTTLGLGMACLCTLAVLAVTGLTLFLYYQPDQQQAYERILHISTALRFGGFVRDLHYLSGNLLLVFAALHLTRVFLTGSYKGRRLNWFYGLGLFVLILSANFTGYLLPWDQISYWAIQVGASLADYFPLLGPWLKAVILGGHEVGPETLLRSFALHAGGIPALMLVLVSLHLWRIRKDGGLGLPPQAASERVPSSPALYRAEAAVCFLSLALLLALTLVVDAPIHERANPAHPPNPAKSPWYFVGFQEMLGYSVWFGGMLAPAILALFMALAPFADRSASPPGLWFAKDRRLWNLAFLLLVLSQVAFIVLGQWFRGKNWALLWPF